MKRKVIQHGLRDECSAEMETTGHVLWSYQKAKDAWVCSKVIVRMGGDECGSFFDFLWQLVMTVRVEEDKLAQIVTIAWALWCNRNEVRNGGKWKTGMEITRWAAIYLAEYTAATKSTSFPRQMLELRSLWTPPPASLFKVNVDGAVFSSQGSVGIGVLIRDEEGRVEAALSKKIMAPVGAVEAEAKAFEAGILFAKDIGIQEFILEGDSIIYNALCDTSSPPSAEEPVTIGMHALCRDFGRVEFSHVRRQGNRPTHLLAKHAQSIVDFST
ncbi:hypothetical protein SO802_013105 [Lithocarpus litseifolius]|uniref:RNase H type-1 domain-containing protein n=1 Tax=Lithocarpus litseifolius TaxID=425828 RepID=A0AAW2D7F1_9ROSI